jgi:hypothetical protein
MKLTFRLVGTGVIESMSRGEQESGAFHDTVISLAQHSGINPHSTARSSGEACYNLSHRIGKTLIHVCPSQYLIGQTIFR